MTAKTATEIVIDPRNDAVTVLTDAPLKAADGTPLVAGMRVEATRDGRRGHVVRLDKRSRRAVVTWDAEVGEVTTGTMRQAHLLKVRRVAGKILQVKTIVKAGSIQPPATPRVRAPKAKKAAATVSLVKIAT